MNGRVQAVIERNNPRNLTLVPPADASAATHQLDIVLHALGRVNFGCIWDFKGLVNPDIKLSGETLPHRSHTPYTSSKNVPSHGKLQAIKATLTLAEPHKDQSCSITG